MTTETVTAELYEDLVQSYKQLEHQTNSLMQIIASQKQTHDALLKKLEPAVKALQWMQDNVCETGVTYQMVAEKTLKEITL
jgi:uncharacterized protein YaaR (DUF327 family)